MLIPNEFLHPGPLYNFLKYISESNIDGKMLDCGSGGPSPKQLLFAQLGFDTIGIEYSEERITMAKDYGKQYNINLEMHVGDMRSIQYETNYFGYVYSWNTIFHLNKKDCHIAVNEMIRVLKPGGLNFVNFLSTDSDLYGKGEEQNPGEFVRVNGDEKILHSFFSDDEPDAYFDNLDVEVLYKEKRLLKKKLEDSIFEDGYIDYIIKKK